MTFCLCLWEWLLRIHYRINWINSLILVNPTVISVRKVVEVQVEVFELALRVSWQGWTSRQRPIVVGALARKFAFWPLSTMWLDWSKLWRARNFGQIWAAVGSRGSRRISKSPLWPEEQQHHCNSLSLFWGTRSYAALRAADLDWIVGPGYSLGRVHSGEKPWKTNLEPWKTMETNQKPWNYLEKPWKPAKNHEKPWAWKSGNVIMRQV